MEIEYELTEDDFSKYALHHGLYAAKFRVIMIAVIVTTLTGGLIYEEFTIGNDVSDLAISRWWVITLVVGIPVASFSLGLWADQHFEKNNKSILGKQRIRLERRNTSLL